MKQSFALFFDSNLHTAKEIHTFLHNTLGGSNFRPLLHQILMDVLKERLTCEGDTQREKQSDQLVQTIYMFTQVVQEKLNGLSGGGYEGTEIEISLKNIREVLIPRFYRVDEANGFICRPIPKEEYLGVFQTCLTHHNNLYKLKKGLIALNSDDFCGTLAGITGAAVYNNLTDLGPLISCKDDVNTEAFLATGAMGAATVAFATARALVGRTLTAQMKADERQENELLQFCIQGLGQELREALFSTTAVESSLRKKMNRFAEKRLDYKGHKNSTDNAVRERTIYFLQDTGGMSEEVANILNSHVVTKEELESKKTFVSLIDAQHELESLVRETPNPFAKADDGKTILENKLRELKKKFLKADRENGLEKFRQAVHFAPLEVDGKRGTLYNLLCLKVTTKEGFFSSLKRRQGSLSPRRALTLKSDQIRYQSLNSSGNPIDQTETLDKLNRIFLDEYLVGLPNETTVKTLSKQKEKLFVDEKILNLLYRLKNTETVQEMEIVYENIKQHFYTKDRELATKLRHVVIMGIMSNQSPQITSADRAYFFKRLHHDVQMAYSLVKVAGYTFRQNKGPYALLAQARKAVPLELVAASGYQGFAIAKDVNAIEHAAGSGPHLISEATGSLSFETVGSSLGCWALFIAMIGPILKYRNTQKTTEIASMESTFHVLHKEYESRATREASSSTPSVTQQIQSLAKVVADAKKGSLSLTSHVVPGFTIQDVLNNFREGQHGADALRATLEDYHCQSEPLIIALTKKLNAQDAEQLDQFYYHARDTEKTIQDYYQLRYGEGVNVERFSYSDRMRKYLELEWAKKAPSQEQAQFLMLKAKMCLKNWKENKNLNEEEAKACQEEVRKFARSDKMKILRQESKIKVFLKEAAVRTLLYGQWGAIKVFLPALVHALVPIIKTIFITAIIPVVKVVLGATVASAIAGFMATPWGAAIIVVGIIVALLCVYGGIRIGGNHYFTDYFDTSKNTDANQFAEQQIELMDARKPPVAKVTRESEYSPLLSTEDVPETSVKLSQTTTVVSDDYYVQLLNEKCSGAARPLLDSFLLNLFNDILQYRSETLPFGEKKLMLTASTDCDQLMKNIKRLINIISKSSLELCIKLDLIMGLKQGAVTGEGGYVRLSLAPIKQYLYSSLAGMSTSVGADLTTAQNAFASHAKGDDTTSIGFAVAAVIAQTIADVFSVQSGSSFSDRKDKHLPWTHPFIQYLEEQIYNLFYPDSPSAELREQIEKARRSSPYKRELDDIFVNVNARMQACKEKGQDEDEKKRRHWYKIAHPWRQWSAEAVASK